MHRGTRRNNRIAIAASSTRTFGKKRAMAPAPRENGHHPNPSTSEGSPTAAPNTQQPAVQPPLQHSRRTYPTPPLVSSKPTSHSSPLQSSGDGKESRRSSISRATCLQLSPLVMAAFVLGTNPSEDVVWTSPVVLGCMVWYWLVLAGLRRDSGKPEQAPLEVMVRRLTVDACFVVWMAWLFRREVYVHHGEPWKGWSLFLPRVVGLFVVGGWLSTRAQVWRSSASVVLLQLHVVMLLVPYAGDALTTVGRSAEELRGDQFVHTTLLVSPIVKSLCLVLTPLLLEPYWSQEDMDHSRVSQPQVMNRMILQYSLVMGVTWWLSPVAMLGIWLVVRTSTSQKEHVLPITSVK